MRWTFSIAVVSQLVNSFESTMFLCSHGWFFLDRFLCASLFEDKCSWHSSFFSFLVEKFSQFFTESLIQHRPFRVLPLFLRLFKLARWASHQGLTGVEEERVLFRRLFCPAWVKVEQTWSKDVFRLAWDSSAAMHEVKTFKLTCLSENLEGWRYESIN